MARALGKLDEFLRYELVAVKTNGKLAAPVWEWLFRELMKDFIRFLLLAIIFFVGDHHNPLSTATFITRIARRYPIALCSFPMIETAKRFSNCGNDFIFNIM